MLCYVKSHNIQYIYTIYNLFIYIKYRLPYLSDSHQSLQTVVTIARATRDRNGLLKSKFLFFFEGKKIERVVLELGKASRS